MAVIGVRNCKFNGNTVGKVTSVSVSYNFKQFSKLNQNQYRYDSASVSIVSIGGYADDIFNTSGTLTWDTVEMEAGQKKIYSNVLYNVTLVEPNLSAVTKNESGVTFTTYSISGSCHYCPFGVIKYEKIVPSANPVRTSVVEVNVEYNNIWDHYYICNHADARRIAKQIEATFNPDISLPVYIWDEENTKFLIVSAVQRVPVTFEFSGLYEDYVTMRKSVGLLIDSWNNGYSYHGFNYPGYSENLFDNDQLLSASGWSRVNDDTGSYYKGEFSALISQYYESGGFDIGQREQDELLWVKLTYAAQAASYNQNAFFGWDNRSGYLWPSAFPRERMNSRETLTVSGYVRYYNGMFPMCGQSSYFNFYNSSSSAKNAINVYKFYGTII